MTHTFSDKSEESAPRKVKKYTAPALKSFGRLMELTTGGSNNAVEGANDNSKKKVRP
jgi:hypothetical protein